MSTKVFQEGYEASLRESGPQEAKISRLLKKTRQIYRDIFESETNDLAESETDHVDCEQFEVLITKAYSDPQDTHYRAEALHQVPSIVDV